MKFLFVIYYFQTFWFLCKGNANLKNIIVPAFENFAELGEIYNAKTNEFTRINILNSGTIDRFVKINDTPQIMSKFDSASTTAEKLKLFDFDGEVKLKILANFMNIGGAQGKYIKNSKYNTNSAEFSYILQAKTKFESLKWDNSDLQQLYDLSKIRNHGTHMIVGIQYGGNAFLTISQRLNRTSSSRQAEVQNKLGITLIEALNIGTLSDTKFPHNETTMNLNYDITVEADISPKEGDNLITLESAVKFVNSLSGRLRKYNNGKGVILYYEMIPLHYINSINKQFTTLSSNTIYSVNEKLLYLEAINKKINEFYHELEENIIYFTDEQHLEWNDQKLRFESNISSMYETINNVISFYHTNKSQAHNQLQKISAAITTLKREVRLYNKACENLLIKMDFIKNAEEYNFQYIFQDRQFEAFKLNYSTSVVYFFSNKNYKDYRHLFLRYLKNVIQDKSPQHILAIINADKFNITINNKTFEETGEYPLYLYDEHQYHRIIHTYKGYTTFPLTTTAIIGLARTNAKCVTYDCPLKLHPMIPKNTTVPTTLRFSHWFNVYAIKPKTKIEIYFESYKQIILKIDVDVFVSGKKERFELTMQINSNATLLIYITNDHFQELFTERIDYPYLENKKYAHFKRDAEQP